jgi:filamentous hemagglutinin family protein
MRPIHHIRILNRLRGGFGTAVLLGILIPQLAVANPLGPQVVSGQASFATQGKTLSVTNNDRAIINWQDFSIGNGELTRFIQPTATSAVLNRVIGNNPSAIYGALQSNGRVYLVNQNGIFIGPTATIDVNGLVASTLNITDGDFRAGRINFSGGPLAGKIENQGAIRTPAGGSIYLIAPDVTNSGIINAPNGDILLAAGQQVSLVESTTPEIAVVISAPENQALNLGRIIAEAGRIGIYGGLIQHRGIVSADSVVMDKTGAIHFRATNDITFDKESSTTANGPKGGNITVRSEEGTTLVSGAVEAKGSSDKGGTVQLLGRRVGVIDTAQIDASGENGGGTVLVGGDYQGKNPAVQNAEATYFGVDASIRADAVTNGDGGKVILWADDATRFYGSIIARGGADGGNGGFVEISGKKALDFIGKVDTTSPIGHLGTLLLDPADIIVATVGTAAYADVNDFAANPGTTQTITPATLIAVGGNVTLQATNSITFTNDLNLTAYSASLTAQAYGNITVNAYITTNGGAINLTGGAVTINSFIQATPPADVTIISNGPLTIGSGAEVTTQGNITLTAGPLGVGMPAYNLTVNGSVWSSGNNIYLRAGNEIILGPYYSLSAPSGGVYQYPNLNAPAPEPITCPTGQQLVGDICQPITCPTGQHLVGNTCQAITCPTGQQLVGNTCEPITCPTGQKLVGNYCEPIICPTGQQLVGNLCQPIICTGGQQLVGSLCTCPGGQVFIGAGCQCPAGTIDYAGVCKTPSIVPGSDSSTVIFFPATEELTEPLQVLVKSIINTVDPSLFRTSGSPGGGAGDDLKPKKNYCN